MTLNISDVFITLDFKNSAICVEIKKQIRPATYRIELKPIQFALYAMLLDYMINKHKKVKTPAKIDKDELFNNWIQIYSYLPVDLSNIEAFRFQDQIEEEINDKNTMCDLIKAEGELEEETRRCAIQRGWARL